MSSQPSALFERVSIIRTEERIPSQGKNLRNNKPYTVYVLRIKAGGTAWIVTRRYREFRALHLSLCKMLKLQSKRMQKQHKKQQQQKEEGKNRLSSKFRLSLSALASSNRSKKYPDKAAKSVNDPYQERATHSDWLNDDNEDDESSSAIIDEGDVLSDVDDSSEENNNIHDNNNNNSNNLNNNNTQLSPGLLNSSITKDWDTNRISSPTVLPSNEPSFLDDQFLIDNNVQKKNNNIDAPMHSKKGIMSPPSPSFNPKMLPPFPGRSLGGSTNPEVVEKRKSMLENYIRHICIFEPQLCFTTQVLSFLDIQASPISYLFDHMFTDSTVNRSKFTVELRDCKRDLMRQIEEQRRVLSMLSEQEKELDKFRLEAETAPTHNGTDNVIDEGKTMNNSDIEVEDNNNNVVRSSSSNKQQLQEIEEASRRLDQRYNVHMDAVERLKRHLSELRLKGDEFFNVRVKQVKYRSRKMNVTGIVTVDPSGRIFIRKQDITDLRVTMDGKVNTEQGHESLSNNNTSSKSEQFLQSKLDHSRIDDSPGTQSSPGNVTHYKSSGDICEMNNDSQKTSMRRTASAGAIVDEVLSRSFHRVIEKKPKFTIEKTEPEDLSLIKDYNMNQHSSDSSHSSEELSSFSKIIDMIHMHEISKVSDKTHGTKQQDRYRSDGMGQVVLEFKNSPHNCILETKESVELVEVLGAQLKQYNISRMNTCSYLRSRWLRRQIQFNEKDNEHEKALLEFWNLVSPNVPLPARKCKEWERVGFQGKDPGTDFRGMGMLGLDNLVYMAQTATEFCRTVIDKQRSYPFAVGCINITAMLFDLLSITEDLIQRQGVASSSWDTPLFHLMCREFAAKSDAKPFEELYIVACKLLDRIWTEWDAGYMQFGNVLAETKKRIRDALATHPMNIAALAQLVGVDNYDPS